MSVEDPRLSNISEENLTENFSSEIQEEIAASSTPSPIEHEIQVAQAGDGRTPTTNRIPTDPNAPAAAPAAPAAEVTPDANNIVHLATTVSIDDIRVDGANLILVQADGTEIVIVNGAAKIPTMLIGEVEVPQQVLFAALEDSGINVAAGPDGSFSATGRPASSGAEFDDSIQGSQNDPIQLASLLGDTEFGDGGGLDDRTAADDQPDAFDMGSPFIFSESVLADDVVGNETITGVLAFDGGDDFGIVSSVNYQGASDMAEGTGSGVAAPLTSGGQAVTVSTSADGLTITGTITVGETTVTVFTLTVTNPTTGAFTYTQSQPLDHPDLGQIGADDALRLNFTFTVTDKDGDSDTGSFSIEIGDDGPSIGGSVTLVPVNEDDLSSGNDEGEPRESLVSSADLGIAWGADANVKGESEGDAFGRSIAFNEDGLPQNLTSGGLEIVYGEPTVSANGTVTITAYKGNVEGPAVFTVTLDPTSEHGTATFELKGPLDHASESDALPLTFNYTATDADGDSQAGSFSVTVDDDIPVVGENALVQLDDDALSGGNPEGNGDDADSVNAKGVLAHSYGADGAGSVLWIGSGLTLPAGFTATPSEDGKVMTIYQGERPVVSITITDTATGAYQVTQLAPINHPQGTIPGTEDNVQFTVSYQVTDKDGDAAATPGTLTINVDDDIPVVGENALVQLDDDALSGGNPEGNGDDADSVNAKGVLAHAYGADGAGSVLWIGSGLTLPAGFTATPSEDGKVMTIYQGERPVVSITITDTATGAYQVTQLAPINHPQGTIPGTEDNVQFTVSYQVTDKDGDAAATPGTLTINVDDDIPVVVANETLQLDDDTLGGNAGGEGDDTPTATSGVLGHSFGADGPGSISWSASGLTLPSGFWFVRSEDGSQLTITQNQNGAYLPVFKLVIDNAATGDYHVVQLAPVNHQGTNPGFEDNISVTVSYEVKDGDNDVATGTLKIDIDDDTAKIGTPFAGGIVEEEQGVVIGAGNEDTSGTGDADGFGGFLGLQFQDRTTNKASGTLAISWGSDNADNEMITSGAGNRSVAFGPAAIANLDAQNLTSRGLELVYTLSADGTVLTAHAGTETGQTVFTVTLSDNGSGSYTFTLIDTLDHPVSGEDQIALNFQFTATDSDGDTTAPATFIVNVIDDVPTAGTVFARYVEEEALSGGNEDVSPFGVELTGAVLNGGPITDKIGASLNISWGGDDSNTVANGGFTGTQVMGDRSVVFAASGAAATVVAAADAAAFLTVKSGNTTLDLASLTSGGQALVYTLSANGTVLTAHAGSANGTAVFTVTLSDAGKGSYSFDLDGVIDHPVKASGANNEDVLTFNFTATARDSDGDIVKNNFQVNVIDDSPIANPGTASTVEDESVNSGNNEPEDGYTAKAEHVSLNIQWGADNANDANGQPGDRSVAFSNANVTVVGEAGNSLTSLGVAVHTAILANGTLVGYTGNTPPTTTGAGNVVFFATVSDVNNGEYNFHLVKPLDHDTSPSNSENSLSLKFNYTATDSDGDTSSSTFTVNVVDDVAKIGTPFAGGIVEEEQGVVIGAGNEDTSGAGDADALFGLLDRTTQTTGGTLAISWGSDNADNDAITSGAGNRSVAFGPAAITNLDAQNLTSRGLELVYTLSADGTVLTAHAGTETGQAVFTVTLSDNDSGSYTFTLIDTLDHPVSGEDQIALNFQFTATDSDGDTTAPATFIVNVIDDVPTAGTVFARYVEEEALSGGNEDVSPFGVELTGAVLNGGPITDKIGASLNISWGGDDSNTVANGGFTGTQVMGDRSVVFAASGAAATVVAAADAAAFLTVKSGNTTLDLASLTSGGQALVYTLSANGTVLTAHAGSANGTAVFTVTLSDAGKGSYSFDLDGVIDHPVKASGASNEDVLTFNFTATARDSDGDIVKNNFQVNVIDDSPTIAGPAGSGNVSEVGLPSVSFDFDSLNVKIGADKNNHVAIGTDVNGDPIINAGLTSDGVALHYAILTTNGVDQQLVAFKDGDTVDNPVFIVSVVHPGSFVVTLHQNLDHPAGSDSLTLDLVARVYDGDGDFVDQPFKIDVTDGVPTIGAAPAIQTVFEDGVQTLSNVALSVSWGSDDANSNAGNNDRSLTFAKPVAANNVTVSGPAGALPNLTSNGAQVQFAFVGAYLVGYIGGTIPASAADANLVVFNVLLSDLASGSYTFNLLQPLDHPAPIGTADYIDLAFTYHATDADHDTTAEHTFVVRVDAAGTIDSINYSNLTSSVFVNLDGAAQTVLGQTVAGDRATDGALVTDKVIGIDNVTGINDAMGGSAADILIGGGEANKLTGNGGSDHLDGGLGADILDGGEGDDTFVLGADVTGSGTRNIQLGDGSLVAVNIAGLAGTADKVIGGAGNDTIVLERDGKPGFVADYSTAPGYLSGVEKIVGTDGNDVILLAAGSTADGGPITLEGGNGNDILGGSNSADIINGGDGNDLISGLGGNDTLTGGNGDDVIWGGLGADKVYGGADNDTLIGGKGDDLLDGGTNSAVVFNRPSNPASGDAAAIIASALGGDTADYSSLTTGVLANLGDAATWPAAIPAHSAIDSNGANDAVGTDTLVDIENLTGGIGDDILAGDGKDNILKGGAGSDTLLGGAGKDLLIGGNDNVGDNLYAGSGDDVLILGNGGGTAKGEGGDDLIYGGSSGDWLYGEDDGNPNPADAGDDTIFAGGGNDHIEGGGGADELYGEDGDDTLVGGKGDDIISGGAGNDTIQWSVGDGLDAVDGGTELAGGRDLLRVVGSAASEQYAIWSVAAYNAAHPGAPYAGLAEILLTVNGALAAEVNEIEDIVIQGGGGADTLAVNGSFSGTSLLTSTITYEGGEGDETFNVSELVSGHNVVVNGAGGADVLVIGDEAGESVWKDVTVTQDTATGEFTISLPNGGPVLKATGVESFRFADGTVTAAQLIEQAPTDLTTLGLTVAENSAAGTIVGSVHGVDVNGSIDPLSYAFILADSSTSLTSADGRFVINASTGEISVAAGAVLDYETTPSIGLSVLVTDSKNGSYSETFSVQLTNVNEAPILAHPITDQSIAEEGTISFQIPADAFSDVDSALTYTATLGDGSALPTWLHFDAGTRTFSGTAPLDYNGTLDVKVTAADGSTSVSDTFSIEVTPVNDAPETSAVSASGNEDTMITVALSGTDVDGTVASFVIRTLPSNGILYADAGATQVIAVDQEVTGSVYFKPAPDYNGSASFTYAAKDNTGLVDGSPAGASITINPVDEPVPNNAPVVRSEPFAVGVGYIVSLPSNTNTTHLTQSVTLPSDLFGDSDGDNLTLSASLPSSEWSLGVNGFGQTQISFSKNVPTGIYNIAVSASDGEATTSQVIKIWVAGSTSSSVNGDGNNSDNTIVGGSSPASYDGNAGNDFIDGGGSGDVLSGNSGNDVIYGGTNSAQGSYDWIYGDSGDDYLDGETGDDVLYGDTGNDWLVGGSGNDYLDGGSNNDVLLGGTGNDELDGGDGEDWLDGGIGSDELTGGNNVDTFNISAGSDTIADLGQGGGNDVVKVSSGANVTIDADGDWTATTATVNNGVASIDADGHNINLANAQGANGWTITNSDNSARTLTGSAKADTIISSSAGDTINAGGGADKVIITAGSASRSWTVDLGNDTAEDKIRFNNTDQSSSHGTLAVVSNFQHNDTIAIALGNANLSDGAFQSIAASNTNVLAGVEIVAIAMGVSGTGTLANDGDSSSIESIIADATNNISAGSYTFIVYSSTSASANAGIYTVTISDPTNPGASGMTVEHIMTLNNVGYGTLDAGNFTSASNPIDPIILDLDHNGFAFTSVDDGVKFDINADGKLDQVAWTKTDGILAFDVDGNGKIDNGSEIFTPNFAGGAHAGGVAALSTLDVNHDGKIDASDTGFDKLLVWQDANGNGVSDEGELKGLNDYGITGISLDADSAEGYIDGQALFAEGSFTYADGSTGSFVEVGFDTLFSDAPDHVLVGTDGDDILAAMPGLTQMTGGAGADTFVLDPSALHELDMADIITDYKSSEGDAVDVSKLLDTLLGHQATGEEAAANVRTTIAGNDTTVSVQVATDSWKDVAVLQNHTEAVKILFDDDKHSANISHV